MAHTVLEAEKALEALQNQRRDALSRAKTLADEMSTGTRPDDRAANDTYKRAFDEYTRLGALVEEARKDVANARSDEETAQAFSSSLKRAGVGGFGGPNLPQPATRYGHEFPANGNFVDLSPTSKPVTIADSGRWLRAWMLDDADARKSIEAEFRTTMVEGTTTLGGHLVPVQLLSPMLDLARAKTVMQAARATFVPLTSSTAKLPTHDVDPVFAARSEAGAYAAAQTTLGAVTFTPRSYAAIVRVSDELIEDASVDAAEYLANVLAAAAAVTLDQQVLYGGGVAPAVQGIVGTAGVTSTNAGANGLAITSWDPITNVVGAVRTANYEPTAMVTSPRQGVKMGLLREGGSSGGYLARPPYLENLPWLETSSVPVTQVVGTSGANCTSVITGDFSKVAIGIRHELRIKKLSELYAGTGEQAFAAEFRWDVQVGRPAAFQILAGLL